jgi:hypothetical protein
MATGAPVITDFRNKIGQQQSSTAHYSLVSGPFTWGRLDITRTVVELARECGDERARRANNTSASGR